MPLSRTARLVRDTMVDRAHRAFLALDKALPRETQAAWTAAEAGEQRHRRGGFRKYHPHACTVDVAAEVFVVRWAAEALTRGTLTLGAAAKMRPDAVLAYAMVEDHRAKVAEAFSMAGVSVAELLAVDYVTLVNPERLDERAKAAA